MSFILYLVAGILGGFLGGMGMGGGTILIPILTIIFNVNQHLSQAINLISFIPMALFALNVHIKNKLIDFKGSLVIIIPAVIFAILGAIVAKTIDGDILKKMFGIFLIILSIFQFFIKKPQ